MASRAIPLDAYAGKVAIRHAVAAARDNGIDVAGIEVSPGGTIRVLEARAIPKAEESEFDRWEAAGKL